jgi:hypothetical protein
MPAPGSPDHDPDDELTDDMLTDDVLESEIELVSELVVAATSSDGPLGQDVVDRILGVAPRDGQAQPKRPEM